MTVIKINAITVPPESGDELARRFANRAGAVDGADGFEGFELMRPVDDRETWLVVTRWRDDAAFEAWVASPAFGHGHRGSAEGSGAHGSRRGTVRVARTADMAATVRVARTADMAATVTPLPRYR